jgi:hypothetical protein
MIDKIKNIVSNIENKMADRSWDRKVWAATYLQDVSFLLSEIDWRDRKLKPICECDELRDKIRAKNSFCRVCGKEAAQEMDNKDKRISDLERGRDDKLKETCIWAKTEDVYDDDLWSTSCGQEYYIIDATPSENHMRFCCFCGKKIEEGE